LKKADYGVKRLKMGQAFVDIRAVFHIIKTTPLHDSVSCRPRLPVKPGYDVVQPALDEDRVWSRLFYCEHVFSSFPGSSLETSLSYGSGHLYFSLQASARLRREWLESRECYHAEGVKDPRNKEGKFLP
jgi:hypothetical protein